MQLTGMTGSTGAGCERRWSASAPQDAGRASPWALGVHDVSVLTHREAAAVAAPIHSVRLITYARDPDRPGQTLDLDGQHESMAEFLAEHDIVVNCVFQDTDAPLMFVTQRRALPVSPRERCSSTSPSTPGWASSGRGRRRFDDPIFDDRRRRCSCYAVDHSPSLLWDSATWEISRALMPYLPDAHRRARGVGGDETLGRAIEIRDGVIQNPKILSFQGRAEDYPHARL